MSSGRGDTLGYSLAEYSVGPSKQITVNSSNISKSCPEIQTTDDALSRVANVPFLKGMITGLIQDLFNQYKRQKIKGINREIEIYNKFGTSLDPLTQIRLKGLTAKTNSSFFMDWIIDTGLLSSNEMFRDCYQMIYNAFECKIPENEISKRITDFFIQYFAKVKLQDLQILKTTLEKSQEFLQEIIGNEDPLTEFYPLPKIPKLQRPTYTKPPASHSLVKFSICKSWEKNSKTQPLDTSAESTPVPNGSYRS